MRAPDPDDGRWTWAVATQLLDTLERAGYRRSDDTHVGQALHLLHLAARIYAGETSPPSGSAQLSRICRRHNRTAGDCRVRLDGRD